MILQSQTHWTKSTKPPTSNLEFCSCVVDSEIQSNYEEEGEKPMWVSGHYHKYEEGEVCGICGH